MATMTAPATGAIPAKTTDIFNKNLGPQIASTATPGSVAGGVTANPTPQQNTGPGQIGQVKYDSVITPDNSLRDKRIAFDVGSAQVAAPGGYERVKSQKTTGSIKKAFDAQQPVLMQQFKDESRALVQRTAAMGRTGSGLFNRDTGYVGDRALQARESLLGNLAFQATQADANRALQASLGNQGAGVSMAGISAQVAAGNAARAQQADILRQNHMMGLQQREDWLAQQAMANLNIQAGMNQQGFSGDPTGANLGAANVLQGAGQEYGANAAGTNTSITDLASQAVQGWQNGASPAQRAPASASYAPGQTGPTPGLIIPSTGGYALPKPTANWNINSFPKGQDYLGQGA
jgi:hypothetical protein